jgi:hypothetical protein
MNLREIDRLVATKVMGWKIYADSAGYKFWSINEDDRSRIIYSVTSFEPTKDIADAWQVVEKLIDEGYDINVYNHNKEFNVEINIEEDDKHLWFYGEADSAPLAICLAALKAVGVEVEVTEQ